MDEFDSEAEKGREMHDTHSAIQAHHQQMMKIRFIVPQGVRPGQKILVNSPNGKHISVVIPRMAQPGSSITVMVPAGIPSPTKLNGDNSITNPMLNSGPSTNTSSNEESEGEEKSSDDEEELDLVI
jgi:hypothetical protein